MHDDDEEISAINVTPFVDVVLVLLVIFMVTAKLIINPVIPVDLPKAAAAAQAVEAPLRVVIEADGDLSFNGARATIDDLMRHINSPETPIIVSADKSAPHGRGVEVLDGMRKVDGRRFAIEVTRE